MSVAYTELSRGMKKVHSLGLELSESGYRTGEHLNSDFVSAYLEECSCFYRIREV